MASCEAASKASPEPGEGTFPTAHFGSAAASCAAVGAWSRGDDTRRIVPAHIGLFPRPRPALDPVPRGKGVHDRLVMLGMEQHHRPPTEGVGIVEQSPRRFARPVLCRAPLNPGEIAAVRATEDVDSGAAVRRSRRRRRVPSSPSKPRSAGRFGMGRLGLRHFSRRNRLPPAARPAEGRAAEAGPAGGFRPGPAAAEGRAGRGRGGGRARRGFSDRVRRP